MNFVRELELKVMYVIENIIVIFRRYQNILCEPWREGLYTYLCIDTSSKFVFKIVQLIEDLFSSIMKEKLDLIK